jgi:hypothetical protein
MVADDGASRDFGERHKGIEYSGWDDETGTVRSRLMGTDGSRFTYTYALEDHVFHYWFGEKDSPIFSRGVISRMGAPSTVAGRSPAPPETVMTGA